MPSSLAPDTQTSSLSYWGAHGIRQNGCCKIKNSSVYQLCAKPNESTSLDFQENKTNNGNHQKLKSVYGAKIPSSNASSKKTSRTLAALCL